MKCWWRSRCPRRNRAAGSCFMEAARRRGDFAIVGIAAMITPSLRDECATARGGVALANAHEATIGYWLYWLFQDRTGLRCPARRQCHRPNSAERTAQCNLPMTSWRYAADFCQSWSIRRGIPTGRVVNRRCIWSQNHYTLVVGFAAVQLIFSVGDQARLLRRAVAV
jgi:hypothetical protein